MTVSQLSRRTRTRAVAPEDKSERRAAIVRAAAALLRRDPAGSFSVEELARRAGVAKGTLYLYFGTREEVLLAVHGERSQRLLDAVAAALDAPPVTAESVVRATLEYLHATPEFLPLAATCRAMLEANIGAEAALGFKLALGQRLAELGARVEAAYPGMAQGEGVRLLTNGYALMLGLWQLADPPAVLAQVMQRPDMQVFRIDFERQLADALVDLWRAAERRSRGESP